MLLQNKKYIFVCFFCLKKKTLTDNQKCMPVRCLNFVVNNITEHGTGAFKF